MQQHALELALKKAKRYGYDKSYIPELYAEYMQVLKLQSQSKLLGKRLEVITCNPTAK